MAGEDSHCDEFLESRNAKVMKSHNNQSPLSEPNPDRISELPEGLQIHILSFLDKALSYLKLIEKPSPVFGCKYVTVELPIWKYNLPGIADLLQSSAYLEKLIIKIVNLDQLDFCNYLDDICDFDGNTYLSMQMGDFTHLKNVEFDCDVESDRDEEFCYRDEVRTSEEAWYDFELIEYILKNSPVLEKLVIKSRKRNCYKCSENCSLQYVSQMSHKLFGVCKDGGRTKELELKTKQSDFEIRICNSGSKSSTH